MAKTKQAQEESLLLTPKQARAITALYIEREEIRRQANEQIGEIMEAFQEQGRMLALVHQLPRGNGVTYAFEDVDVDGQRRIRLTAVPAPEEEESDGKVELSTDPD